MPFTPLHMGPGLLIKSALRGRFSLMVFGWSQVVMDIQPLLAMLRGEGQLHGMTHTYLGAALLAVFAAITGKPLAEWALRVLRIDGDGRPLSIEWGVVWLSAVIGTFTHVALDAVMHSDVEPYLPLTVHNNLFGLLSITALHEFCLYSAAVGAAFYFAVNYLQRKPPPPRRPGGDGTAVE